MACGERKRVSSGERWRGCASRIGHWRFSRDKSRIYLAPGYFRAKEKRRVNTDLDSTFFGNDMRLANLSPNSVPLLKTDPGCGIKMQIRGFGRGATEWSESYFLQNVPSVHLSKKGGQTTSCSILSSISCSPREKARISSIARWTCLIRERWMDGWSIGKKCTKGTKIFRRKVEILRTPFIIINIPKIRASYCN